ncbi:MAG: DUF3105 domain-containing protein [Byssovorax sp.]
MRRRLLQLGPLLLATSALLPLGLTAAGGCGGGTTGSGSSTTGGDAGKEPVTVTLHPSAPPLTGQSECTVVITTGIQVPQALHVPVCTAVHYSTNPPSGGNHWPIWAAFAKSDLPVPREMYVHDMEHGGLILLHNADPADKDAVVAALDKAFDGFTEPFCEKQGGVPARLVVTPDAQIKTPIAIAGWGATYTATCIDEASINDFISNNIGHGTEALCSDGQNPTLVTALCLGTDGGTGAGGGGGQGGAGGSGGQGGAAGAGGAGGGG